MSLATITSKEYWKNVDTEAYWKNVEVVINHLPVLREYVDFFSQSSFQDLPEPSDLASLISKGKRQDIKQLGKLSAHMGFIFEYRPSVPEGEGFIQVCKDELFGIIYLNPKTSLHRQEYVVAHELGHVFLPLFLYAKRLSSLDGKDNLHTRSELDENYCTAFGEAITGYSKERLYQNLSLM